MKKLMIVILSSLILMALSGAVSAASYSGSSRDKVVTKQYQKTDRKGRTANVTVTKHSYYRYDSRSGYGYRNYGYGYRGYNGYGYRSYGGYGYRGGYYRPRTSYYAPVRTSHVVVINIDLFGFLTPKNDTPCLMTTPGHWEYCNGQSVWLPDYLR